MAKIVFKKDTENQIGELCHIVRDQAFMDSNKNFNEADYTILDITTEEFNDIKYGQKQVISYTGSSVNFFVRGTPDPAAPNPSASGGPFFSTTEDLREYIKSNLEILKNYVENNSEKPLGALVNSYVTYLERLNISTLTPLNISLEQYASDQGQDPVHLLELI